MVCSLTGGTPMTLLGVTIDVLIGTRIHRRFQT